MNKSFAVRGAAFLVAFGAAHSAHATFFYVNTTDDSYTEGDGVCSLREALETANFNDCWTDCGCGDATGADFVYLASDTYSLSSAITIWGQGPLYFGASDGIAVIRADDSFNPFLGLIVSNQGTKNFVEFYNFALENFTSPALTVDQGSSLYAYYLDVRNNHFTPNAGTQNAGVQLLQDAYLYLSSSSVHDNSEGPKGGGVFINTDATLDLESSAILNNDATQYGGGIFNRGQVYCSGASYISGNYAHYEGGGVYNYAPGYFIGDAQCSVTGNTKQMPNSSARIPSDIFGP